MAKVLCSSFFKTISILVLIISIHSVHGGLYKSLDKLRTKTSPEVQRQTVKDMILRLLPERGNEFDVQIEPPLPEEENGYFEITKGLSDAVVLIKASTGVLAAWGFHYYLTQHCNCHVSWDADQLNLPAVLPAISVRIASQDKFRYYQNTCTVSYSSAFWDWVRWERDIDWMAMNGINLPLAFTGQEAVWQKVYLSFNLTQRDIDEHFAGPAFFAWQRFGNFRGWGGPLSNSWHEWTLLLQHQILDRMRNFGMIPVLPAFAGHIPRAFERVYPNASYTHLTPWLGFEDQYCCPTFLQPTDPLFPAIGSSFLSELIQEFGTDHVYNSDIFNEMRPLQEDPPYISMVGRAVFDAMTEIDPDAIWMMQGWLFKNDQTFWTLERAEALLTSVPLGRMLVLDLQAEIEPQYGILQSFYGQPFIFCLLHNFGGTLGMYGAMSGVAQRVLDARSYPNSTFVGTGLTMEGIHQNYVVYDNMLEMGWRDHVPNQDQWFDNYTSRRYGVSNDGLMRAWRLLQRGVYNDTRGYSYHAQYVLTIRPAPDHYPGLWYNPDDVVLAWDGFIQALDEGVPTGATYQHDLIDVTRQSLQEFFHLLYSQLITAYWDKNTTAYDDAAGKMIDILQDMDLLLNTGSNFLLGKWIANAKRLATNIQEELQYEWNARNQITLWGPRGEILDYATKQWAGMLVDYYRPRWQLFITDLKNAMDNDVPYNQTAYAIKVFNSVEKPFTFDTKFYSNVPF